MNFKTAAVATLLTVTGILGVAQSASSQTFHKTCRFEKVGQPMIQMPCKMTDGNRSNEFIVTWADGAVDSYRIINERNNIVKVVDGLGNFWYIDARGEKAILQHESGDREVFIF